MTLRVIGAGFGRTGTNSLRLALNELGLGPCHHMFEVRAGAAAQVPLWNAALDGRADWDAIYDGFASAVDWPTAAFWPELAARWPEAKVILSTRSAESWWDSLEETIVASLSEGDDGRNREMQAFRRMARRVLDRSLGAGFDRAAAIAAFEANEAAALASLPPERVLRHAAPDGWAPLCRFLGVPVPDTPYPRTNSKDEFFAAIPERPAEG